MTETEKNAPNDFSSRMVDILNGGALNLAMGIGYQTGLFEAMDTLGVPATSAKIAEKAGLAERYVREWLGVMCTGGIVEITEANGPQPLFLLPRAHGDLLTRRAGNANLGVYTQEIPLLTACAMEAVVAGFKTGEGVSYDHYPRFQAFMTQLADAKHQQVLIDTFLPSVDSGHMVKRIASGIRVCDLGCGEGTAPLLMAEAFPQSQFLAIDIGAEAIEKAWTEAHRRGLTNIEFRVLDAAALPSDGSLAESFDYVTAFDAIHDQTDPLGALKGARFLLADGGVFSMVDIAAETPIHGNLAHPMGPFLYTVSLLHCLPVGLVNHGEGLGMMWGKQKAEAMLRNAGFSDVRIEAIPQDRFNLHFLCRK
jgi:SAM-dependent methyltransferase